MGLGSPGGRKSRENWNRLSELMEEHSIDVALLNEVSTELLAGVEGSLYELWGTEGVRIMVEVVKRLREIPGVAGAHVMGLGREEPVRRVIDEAGLLPRPG